MTPYGIELVEEGEGCSLKAYFDTEDILSIGWGRNLETNGLSESEIKFGKLTSYQLANMESLIITQELANLMLKNDIALAEASLKNYDWFIKLDDLRKDIIVDMAFNMGLSTFLKFKDMISYLKVKDYNSVANEMMDSDWYRKDVKARGIILVKIMRTGVPLSKSERAQIYRDWKLTNSRKLVY